jgi:hypothetical protein
MRNSSGSADVVTDESKRISMLHSPVFDCTPFDDAKQQQLDDQSDQDDRKQAGKHAWYFR